MIWATIGPAIRLPLTSAAPPPFSTTTAIEIVLPLLVAFATIQAWADSWVPESAVPVLAPTSTPAIFTDDAVPELTTDFIIEFNRFATFALMA